MKLYQKHVGQTVWIAKADLIDRSGSLYKKSVVVYVNTEGGYCRVQEDPTNYASGHVFDTQEGAEIAGRQYVYELIYRRIQDHQFQVGRLLEISKGSS